MNTILGELGKNPKFCEYIKTIESKKSPIAISGLTDVGMTQMISATREFAKRPILVITYNEIQAQKILKDIKYFTDKVYYLPKKEIVTYDYVAESKDLPYERIETLNKMQEMRTGVVITTIEAVLQKMISKKALYKNTLNFKVGDSENLETIKQKLVELGYVRCDLIEGRGQFSVRGGIVDISVNEKEGVRLEFWGDEIDSIRYFNVVSQRSTENIDKITIYPAHEYILESNIEDVITNIRNTIYSEKLQETIEQDIELIKAGNYISKIDRYLNSFYTEQDTILDYITDKYLLFLDGDDELYSNETLKEIDEHIKENKYDIIYLGYENVGHTENYYRISTKENSTREARLICDESFSVSSKVWNVEFLRNNNIRFKEGMYYEDELFSIKSNILSKVTTYGEFPIFKYHRNREGSVMTKPTIKKCSDWYRMVAEVTDLYEITPEEDRKYLLSFLKNESDSIPLRVENIIEALRENRKTKVLPKRNYKFIDVLNEEE